MSRVFAISDLHVDYRENRNFVDSWSSSAYRNDVIIVAGDVTDNMSLLTSTLGSMREKFNKVFYTTGKPILYSEPQFINTSPT